MPRPARAWRFLDRRWQLSLAVVAVGTFLLSFLRVFLSASPPPMTGDAAYWQHTGWYVASGATPFVDMLAGKLLSLETVTVLGFLSGGNMYVLHVLSVLLTSAVVIGTVMLAGYIVHHLTGDGVAAFIAGIGALAFPATHYMPILGFQGKLYALFFGMLGVYLFLKDRPFWSGAAAAAAAGYWQLGIIFPAVIVLLHAQRGVSGLKKAVGGAAVVTAAAVLPIVLAGLTVPMLVQTVIMPLYGGGGEGTSMLLRLGKLGLLLGYAGIVVALGAYGTGRLWRDDWKQSWWLPAVLGWFTIQILFIDFDWVPDLIPFTTTAAVGAGIAVNRAEGRWRAISAGGVAVAAAVSILAFGGLGIVTYPVDSPNYPVNNEAGAGQQPLLPATALAVAERAGIPVTISAPGPAEGREEAAPDLPSMTDMYWNQTVPDTCRYRFGRGMQSWMEATNTSWSDPCGQWPSGLF